MLFVLLPDSESLLKVSRAVWRELVDSRKRDRTGFIFKKIYRDYSNKRILFPSAGLLSFLSGIFVAMASGAGAPGDRPPGDEPLGGKSMTDDELMAVLGEISEEELLKHGIKIVKVRLNPCAPKKQMCKKSPWYIGDESYETIRVDGTYNPFDKRRRHFIILSPPSSASPSPEPMDEDDASAVVPSVSRGNVATVVAWPMPSDPGNNSREVPVSGSAEEANGDSACAAEPRACVSPVCPDYCYGLSPASCDDVEMANECDGPDPVIPSDEEPEPEPEFEVVEESDDSDDDELPRAG